MSVKETKTLSEHNLNLVNVVSNKTVMLRHFFSKGNSFRSRIKKCYIIKKFNKIFAECDSIFCVARMSGLLLIVLMPVHDERFC